ncbi:hypothetical protein [Streptomyces sp. NRRL S-350]|uniref:hypothetical protein n=1 Tax=Streptomyces sp. NRRL S-350 TaxID=1463902 RepID=UPI00068E5279|nr:hypothetical protein [Streptomyces sp. NRRL S-350]
MSDVGNATWIGDTQGPTHTGSGSQNNYSYYYFASERLVRGGADPLRVAAERRRWLTQRFVPPRGYGEAVNRLEDPGTAVLISGADGSGRRTAAVVLLHGTGEAHDPFREVALDDHQGDPIPLAPGERVLIDLSVISEARFPDAQGLVSSYWHKVERVGGRLAVVLHQDRESLLHSDLRQLLVRIGRPNGAHVLVRHLRNAGVAVTSADLYRSALGEVVNTSSMRELQRLHELLTEARSAGGDLDEWAAKAVAALRDRGNEVAQQVAELADGRQRALLFTAAMLEGAPADAVFRLSDRLLRKLGHPEDERPRLDRADLTQRLHDLRVEVSEGRIRFTGLAYAEAVRTHFWLYYPDLRGGFGDWLEDAARETAWLDTPDRQRLIVRLTESALKSGDLDVLTGLVESWAAETKLLPEAMLVLERGLTSETGDSAFRSKIYEWVVGQQLHANLVRGLARICADVMATRHPGQALVRLHHLTRREAQDGPRYGREALFELVGRDKRLYLKLLDRLCEGLERRVPMRPDAGIFLELVDPLPGWVPRAEVVRGWRGVLAVSPAEAWESGIRTWLSAARRAPDGGGRLMRVLTDAADGRVDVLNRYYRLAHGWANEADDSPAEASRAEVLARFCREIDRAQGIEPLVGVTWGRGL